MGILRVAVILAMFGFTISQMVRGRMSVLLRIFCFAISLTIIGLLILPILISMGISGGDVAGVIGNKILLGLESVRIAFVKVFGSLFFSDAYDGTVWIAVAVPVIGGIIFLRRRRKK